MPMLANGCPHFWQACMVPRLNPVCHTSEHDPDDASSSHGQKTSRPVVRSVVRHSFAGACAIAVPMAYIPTAAIVSREEMGRCPDNGDIVAKVVHN
jgi:hypothetical protein